MTDNRDVGGDQQYQPGDLDDEVEQEVAKFASLTEEQSREREVIVKAIGQRCNALMRYDGKDPALVASALLWCGISMYVQGAPDLTKDGLLLVCGSTFEEAKAFVEAAKKVEEKKRGEIDGTKQDE